MGIAGDISWTLRWSKGCLGPILRPQGKAAEMSAAAAGKKFFDGRRVQVRLYRP